MTIIFFDIIQSKTEENENFHIKKNDPISCDFLGFKHISFKTAYECD